MSGEERCHVRFGSKADICSALAHVCFTPNSDIDCVFRRVRFGPKADIRVVTRLKNYRPGSASATSLLSRRLQKLPNGLKYQYVAQLESRL
jgi:hypothetical protein